MKIGLKIWSTNDYYFSQAQSLYALDVFDYVELFVVPHSSQYIDLWKRLGIPIILHAPHEMAGLNFAMPSYQNQNMILLDIVEEYRLALEPSIIIFHPGHSGIVDETIKQINVGSQHYPNMFEIAVIENIPQFGLNHEVCVGYDYDSLKKIIDQTDIGFCFDVAHAIVSSASEMVSWKEKLDQLLVLSPKIFHLSDGEYGSIIDKHLHLGEGDFDLSYILKKINSEQSMVSLETPKNNQVDLKDFELDVTYLRGLLERD